ncbi:MAG: hypothetical protein P1U44_11570 [Vicingaceae bacterium]|jgi:hypothetical protein|nr:hypothetical protein [Flavobacteriales bacterium]MDF1676346.1 hypothetical protein [Vicingaceae bacterium]|tara:strand:+ start:33754 stop:33924 length:171 start_codon:yes stop_codon:yes gene_type:complete
MDSNLILFLVTALFLGAIFGVLYIMSKNYKPKKKRREHLEALRKMRALRNKQKVKA